MAFNRMQWCPWDGAFSEEERRPWPLLKGTLDRSHGLLGLDRCESLLAKSYLTPPREAT